MAEALVINTGPIVALCLAGATEFVGRLPFEFLAPTEVGAEVAAGQRLGYRVAVPEWVSVVALEQPVGALGQSTLDAGEAAVIELALQRRISLVAIDEARAGSETPARPTVPVLSLLSVRRSRLQRFGHAPNPVFSTTGSAGSARWAGATRFESYLGSHSPTWLVNNGRRACSCVEGRMVPPVRTYPRYVPD